MRYVICLFAALCIYASTAMRCTAQDLTPVIRLSAEETAKAKQGAQALKDARERNAQARMAWDQFHQTYQAAHLDLLHLTFTEDFRLAVAELPYLPAESARLVKVVELTAEERQKLEALHREFIESAESLKQAEKNWLDYQHQLVADHVPSTTEGNVVTLASGKQVTIPYKWGNGLAFAPDFRLAFPR